MVRFEIVNHVRQERNFEITPALEDYVQKKLRLLDRLLESFPQDQIMLRVIADDEAGPREFQAKLRLSPPSRILSSEEAAPTFPAAFDQAIKELRRQVIDYKGKLRQ